MKITRYEDIMNERNLALDLAAMIGCSPTAGLAIATAAGVWYNIQAKFNLGETMLIDNKIGAAEECVEEVPFQKLNGEIKQ